MNIAVSYRGPKRRDESSDTFGFLDTAGIPLIGVPAAIRFNPNSYRDYYVLEGELGADSAPKARRNENCEEGR
jgi:hypothetical protein